MVLMPKQHRAQGSKSTPETEPQDLPVSQNQTDETTKQVIEGPQYPSEQNPDAPVLDNEPAMRWELQELAHRVAILEAALFADKQEGEGEAASAPA